MNITVIQPFGDYAVGSIISDPKLVAEIISSERAGYVVKSPAPPVPVPAVQQTGATP